MRQRQATVTSSLQKQIQHLLSSATTARNTSNFCDTPSPCDYPNPMEQQLLQKLSASSPSQQITPRRYNVDESSNKDLDIIRLAILTCNGVSSTSQIDIRTTLLKNEI